MGKTKEPRKRTPPDVEVTVLEQSRRRCALCFYLDGDLNEKHGQLAHLDGDRTNYAEENLAFLCIEHHSLYDSKTSQHKNYTLREVKTARRELYDAISEGKHLMVSGSLVTSKLNELKIAALHNLYEVLVKGHYAINRRAKAALPQTENEYRTEVEVHEFKFLDAMTLAKIYLDPETYAAMREVLGSLRQMCTSIWLRLPDVFEIRGKYAEPELREPDWQLFTDSFNVAQAKLQILLNPTTFGGGRR